MEGLQNKEICPHCGQDHDKNLDELTDFANAAASSFTNEAFPLIWKDAKEDIKEMKKRDIAENMFYTGAVQMLVAFLSIPHEKLEEESKAFKE